MSELFRVEDPRAWLDAELGRRGLAQKAFAAQIGVSPPQLNNHLGRRRRLNLSREEGIIAALGLSDGEAAQYRALVALDRARGVRAQERALAEVRAGQRRATGVQAVTVALGDALDLEAAVARELARLQGARSQDDWIAQTLDPPRLPREVPAWRAQLQGCGLTPPAPGGRTQAPPLHVRADGAPQGPVAPLLAAARAAAAAGLERAAYEDRLYGLLFQAMPADLMGPVRGALDALLGRICARGAGAVGEPSPARRVYALVCQLVPLSRSVASDPPARPRAPAPPEPDDPPPPAHGEPPNLYASLDYRRFLADWRAHRSLTLEQIGQRLRGGLPPGHELARQQIHAILHQRAHIAPEHLAAWVKVLGLGVADARYLGACVAWHLADDPVERARCAAELLPLIQLGQGWRVSRHSAALLRSTLAPTVLELARHPAFLPEPGWIQGALTSPWSEAEIHETLDLLFELGCLVWTAAGHCAPALGTIHTDDDELQVGATRALYQEIARIADTPCGADPAARQDLLVLAMPEASVSAARADLEETRLSIQGMVDAALDGRSAEGTTVEPATADRVWLLSLQWLPLSRGGARRV